MRQLVESLGIETHLFARGMARGIDLSRWQISWKARERRISTLRWQACWVGKRSSPSLLIEGIASMAKLKERSQ